MEADTNRAFIAAAQHLVVLADHTKWGVTGLSSIAALDEATTSSSRRLEPATSPSSTKRLTVLSPTSSAG